MQPVREELVLGGCAPVSMPRSILTHCIPACVLPPCTSNDAGLLGCARLAGPGIASPTTPASPPRSLRRTQPAATAKGAQHPWSAPGGRRWLHIRMDAPPWLASNAAVRERHAELHRHASTIHRP